MKSLKHYIIESLNTSKNVEDIQLKAEEYINANYTVSGKLSFENVNGVCIVNCDGDVEVKNKEIKRLTNGFKWGEINGKFDCSYCRSIKSLEGAPEKVRNKFICSWCKNLTSLEGAPKEVEGSFYCDHCIKLESLEGSPKEVGGYFNCSGCVRLKSLEGGPEKVKEIECDEYLKY